MTRDDLIEAALKAVLKSWKAAGVSCLPDYEGADLAARATIAAIEANHYTLRFDRAEWLGTLTEGQLFEEAVKVCRASDRPQVSTSFIQRTMLLGYAKAARIVDRMEAEGVCSAPDNAGRRALLEAGQ
jgi:DNA segregation ATPase FtsK/SpoIIIE-like protein